MSPMPQMPKLMTRTPNRILTGSEPALVRIAWSMVDQSAGDGGAMIEAPRQAPQGRRLTGRGAALCARRPAHRGEGGAAEADRGQLEDERAQGRRIGARPRAGAPRGGAEAGGGARALPARDAAHDGGG